MQSHSFRDAARFWRKTPLLMALLILEIALLASAIWAAVQPPVTYSFTPEQLEVIAGENVTLSYDENGYYGVTYDIDGQDILQTPELSLVPGNYHANVIYAYRPTMTEEGRVHHSNVQLVDKSNELTVAEGALVLDEFRNEQSVLMSVYQPTDHARIVFHNDGGTYTVGGITLTQDMGYAAVCAVWVLLCCLAVDGILLCLLPKSPFYRGEAWATAFVVLGCAVVFASAPLMMEGVDLRGADSVYHLERIEGIAQGLRDGQFPVRLNSAAKSGYGYANSLFYGELFLYIPAFLRLLNVSIQDAYKFYAIGIQIATALIAYNSFKPIFGHRPALAGSVIYLLVPYRLHRFYDPMAVGEYTGFTFLPAIAYGLWLLYHGEPDKATRRRATLVLALSYSAFLQCHMITLELSVLVGALVCLVFWRKTFRKAILFVWAKAIGLAALLNLWFLFPFVTEMLSGSYSRVSTINIQCNGISLAELMHNNNEFGVGIPLLLCGACAACILFGTKDFPLLWSRTGKLCLCIGIAATFLTTKIFPWNALSNIPVVGRVLQVIQFPWRYSTIAALTLILALLCSVAGLVEISRPHAARVALCVCVGAVLVSTTLYWNEYIPLIDETKGLIDTSQLAYEHNYNVNNNMRLDLDNLYIPKEATETNNGFVYNEVVTSVNVGDFAQENGVTTVSYDEYLGQDGHIEFPLLYYPGYQVVEGQGTIFKTANGMVGVLVPAGTSGTVAVAFREPLRWRLATVVSFASLAGLLGYAVVDKRRKKRAAPPVA